MNKLFLVVKDNDGKVLDEFDVTFDGRKIEPRDFINLAKPFIFVQIFFIVLKLSSTISWSWGVVVFPTFIGILTYLFVTSFFGLMMINLINTLIDVVNEKK